MSNNKSFWRIGAAIVGVIILVAIGFFIFSSSNQNAGNEPIVVGNDWVTLTIFKTEVVGTPATTITDFGELVAHEDNISFNIRYCESEEGVRFTRPQMAGRNAVIGSGGLYPEFPIEMDYFIVHHAEHANYTCNFIVEVLNHNTNEEITLSIPLNVSIEAEQTEPTPVPTPSVVNISWDDCSDSNENTECMSVTAPDGSPLIGTCRISLQPYFQEVVTGWENDCSILSNGGFLEFKISEFSPPPIGSVDDTDGQFWSQFVYLEIRRDEGWENALRVRVSRLEIRP